MPVFILDSYALLALLADEAGAEKVAELIERADAEVWMSALNLGEVRYIVQRERGESAAEEVEAYVFADQGLKVMEVTWESIRAAAKLKALGGLSFADCFAAALAQEAGGQVVTGDPEFRKVEGKVQIIWI